jgi:hypothetical protein
MFDNPSTTGFRDNKSGAFFSSDSFGALLQAVPERADDLSDDELRQGQVPWARFARAGGADRVAGWTTDKRSRPG